jgi:hypothetical protein
MSCQYLRDFSDGEINHKISPIPWITKRGTHPLPLLIEGNLNPHFGKGGLGGIFRTNEV